MEALNRLWTAAIDRLGPQLPGLLGALLILVAAWIGARLARLLIERMARRFDLDQRLRFPGMGQLLGTLAHGAIWLLSLPALLDALGMQALLQPLNAMLARLMGVLPNLIGALAVFGIGLLVARILRQVVASVLTALGSEKLSERIGLSAASGKLGLAGLGGSVVFTLVMLPTAAAALQTLGLEIIANPVIRLLDQVLDLVPRFIAGGVIVFIAIVLGRLLSSLVTAALTSAGLNRLPERLGMGSNTLLGGRDLAEWAGTLTMTAALLMAAVQAFEVIGFPALTRAAETLGSTLANLVVALVLLGVGAWLGALAFKAVSAMAGARNPWLARVAQVAVLVFAAALALRQAGLPADIVALAFGALVCSLGLAAAIALGFGGRDVARRLLNAAAGRAGERPEATASEEVSR